MQSHGPRRAGRWAFLLVVLSACSLVNRFDDVEPARDGASGGRPGSGGTRSGGTGGASMDGGEGGSPEGGTGGTVATGGTAGDTGNGGSATGGSAGCSSTTTFYRDADEDSYGDDGETVEACDAPAGYVDRGGDCEDGDEDIHPGADEICNGLDENCDEPDEGSTCPDGCVPEDVNGRLHLLCAGPVAWNAARTTCEDQGMVLARIRGSLDSVAIRTAMGMVHSAPEYWLGGSDGPAAELEGTWRWLAGDVVFYPNTTLYTNWAPGEPATTYPAQDCLKAVMGQWYAEECQLTFPFVCEGRP